MKMIEWTEKEELKAAASSLKLQYFKGCVNVCPKCKTKGYFGSIPDYETEEGNKYLICGWCGTISKIHR